ncbi:MAG: SUEL-type lectin domain-containing protein [Nitrospirae bacterium]|nr:SUEL-type lectin domain-containing protein [Nitrospirota bacterium]
MKKSYIANVVCLVLCLVWFVFLVNAQAEMQIRLRNGRVIDVPVNKDDIVSITFDSGYGAVHIIRARYGRDGNSCDATHFVRTQCENKQYCTLEANNSICGDPAPNVAKDLFVEYRCKNERNARMSRAMENSVVTIACY